MKEIRLIIERQNLEYKKENVGYVLGTVDGQIIDQQNSRKVFYGASMPKLPMALAQLRKFKGTDKALTNKELSMLLDYSKAYQVALKGKHKMSASSNEMFRAICRGDYSSKKGGQSYTREEEDISLGVPSVQDEEDFLKGMDLEELLPGICRSRKGPGSTKKKWLAPNQQTPMGYFKFLSLIHQADQLAHDQDSKLMSLPSENENEIIDVFLRPVFEEIQRLCKGLRKKFKTPTQPEKKTFDFINKEIFNRSKSGGMSLEMWGKGGFTRWKPAMHMAFVINETYILSLYTYYGDPEAGKNSLRKLFADQVYSILSKNSIV